MHIKKHSKIIYTSPYGADANMLISGTFSSSGLTKINSFQEMLRDCIKKQPQHVLAQATHRDFKIQSHVSLRCSSRQCFFILFPHNTIPFECLIGLSNLFFFFMTDTKYSSPKTFYFLQTQSM